MTAAENSPTDSLDDLTTRRPRVIEFTLHPVRSFLFGVAMLVLGALLFALAHTQGDRFGVAMWLLLGFAALGVAFVVLAAARWPWYRRYVKTHGRSPLPPQA